MKLKGLWLTHCCCFWPKMFSLKLLNKWAEGHYIRKSAAMTSRIWTILLHLHPEVNKYNAYVLPSVPALKITLSLEEENFLYQHLR